MIGEAAVGASPHLEAGPTLHARTVARTALSPRLLVALLLALGVLVLEGGGGLLTGSLALLSDATHVAADVVALLIGLTAARLAAREPDAAHSYGFHRMESIGALVNGALLVATSAAVLAESVGRLLAPTPIAATGVLGVGIVALVTNTTSALLVHGIERRTSATRVLVLHLAGDAAGSSAVIAASLVILAGGPPVLDAVASLAIGALLGFAGLRLLGDVVHILAEGVPAEPSYAVADAALRSVPGATGIHDLHVWALAEDLPLVTAHLELQPTADSCDVLPAATQALRRVGVEHATLQLEHEPCGQGRTGPTIRIPGGRTGPASVPQR